MKAYKDMTREELFAEKEKLEAMYQDYKGQNLALNMSRGKPSASQLDLSKGMMDVLRSDSNLTCEDGTDCRNYGASVRWHDRCKARAGNCIWQLQSECYV